MTTDYNLTIKVLDYLFNLTKREYLSQPSSRSLGIFLMQRMIETKKTVKGLEEAKKLSSGNHSVANEDQLEAAAVDLQSRMFKLLASAQVETGMTIREIAEAAKISKSRISQVLDGDANIRITTLARIMRAMGFEVEISIRRV